MVYQNIAMRNYSKGVTPECFDRGSTMLTTTLSHVEWVVGPVPDSPGFPPKDGSVRSHVADPFKACGNDGLRIGNFVKAASCGESNSQ
jgi:hypothetical protein